MYVYHAGVPDQNIFWIDESDLIETKSWLETKAGIQARFEIMFKVSQGIKTPLKDRATPAELRAWRSLLGFLYAARRLAIHNHVTELATPVVHSDYGWDNGYTPSNTGYVLSNFNTGEVVLLLLRENSSYGEEAYAGYEYNRTVPKYQRNVSKARKKP